MSNSKINKNSISPNGIQVDSEGYAVFYPLGTNKVDIPKNSPHWPRGSKLRGSFVYDKDDKLVGFCDTKAMTTEDNGIVVMPYEYIDTEFESIPRGSIQIHAPKATYKKASWTDGEKIDIPDIDYKYKGCKNVNEIKTVDVNYLENDIVDGKWTELLSELENGVNMFRENENITSFDSDLSSLIKCSYMFFECENLKSFNSNLSSLEIGDRMFYNCSNLNTFSFDLRHLTNGTAMFYSCDEMIEIDCDDLSNLNVGTNMFRDCVNLISFNHNLSSLTTGNNMFSYCKKFTSFNSNLKSLTYGGYMFYGCNSLTSFKSNLNSLTDGTSMFTGCKLDASSIKNIIDTINTTESANLFLGIGCNNNTTDKNLFAQEVGYPDMSTLLQTLQDKGWTVSAQYNGRPSSTFSLRKPDSLPVFVKLIEVISTDEDSFYDYTSQDGTKFFNIDWFHETTGSTDGYETFQSLEEAITHHNIKQIER